MRRGEGGNARFFSPSAAEAVARRSGPCQQQSVRRSSSTFSPFHALHVQCALYQSATTDSELDGWRKDHFVLLGSLVSSRCNVEELVIPPLVTSDGGSRDETVVMSVYYALELEGFKFRRTGNEHEHSMQLRTFSFQYDFAIWRSANHIIQSACVNNSVPGYGEAPV